MKSVLVFLFIFISPTLFAQTNPIFKIIACSEGVSIGSIPVKAGMDVLPSNEIINIPVDGYIGVLTTDGYVKKISTLNVNVNEVLTEAKAEKFTRTGAVMGDGKFICIMGNEPMQTKGIQMFMSDTLFAWWAQRERGNFHALKLPPDQGKLVVINRQEQIYAEVETNKNSALLDISGWQTEAEPLGFYYAGRKSTIDGGWFTRVPSSIEKEIRKDIEFYKSDPDRFYYRFAIYQLNGLYQDAALQLYYIMTHNKPASEEMLNVFYARLAKEFDFSLIELK